MRTLRTAPLAALALAALLVVIGCTPPVTKPVITIAADKDSVTVNGTVAFTAAVTPSSATVAWTAAGGTLNPASGTTTTWTAPNAVGDYVVKAVATNSSEKDSATKTIKVKATVPVYLHDEVEYDNIDQYIIPNPGTTFSPIRFPDDEWAPANALVDSVFSVIDVDYGGNPDSVPTMNIWIESPDGSRVQIRNETQSGDPTGEYPSSLLAAFRDKDVCGTWKLIVDQVETNPVVGVIDGFYLSIKYRYQQ
jgi:hypothetical protein